MTESEFLAEHHANARTRRIDAIRAQRPERLSARGDLHNDIADWSRRLTDGTAGNLVVVGGVGVGKSWAVWEALECAVVAGYTGRTMFATSAIWQDAIAPPVDRDTMRAMRSTGILVLDDLGSSRINEWQRECLLSVVDERWQQALPIAITSNLPKLSDALGERLASRLADGATVVALNGADRRRERGAE